MDDGSHFLRYLIEISILNSDMEILYSDKEILNSENPDHRVIQTYQN